MNGVTGSVLRAADHLTSQGHTVRIVAPGPGSRQVLLDNGCRIDVDRVVAANVPSYDSLTCGMPPSRTVRRLITSFRPDVIHLSAPVVLGSRFATMAAKLGVPTVAVYQTDLGGYATDYGFDAAALPVWAWLRHVHSRCDVTLAPTKVVAAELRRRRFERVEIWGRGVDHDQFHPNLRSEGIRAAFGASDDDVLLGYVGRLAVEKSVDNLVEIQDVLRARGARLVIVGDGPDRQRLERLLPDASFTGFRFGEELGATMASLDIFVHTGERETFCQTVQEAQAARTAVIAPAAGGPLDLIEHRSTGLLYQAGNTDSLANAVASLIDDVALREDVADAGFRAVSGRTWASITDELVAHYVRVLSAKGRDVAA